MVTSVRMYYAVVMDGSYVDVRLVGEHSDAYDAWDEAELIHGSHAVAVTADYHEALNRARAISNDGAEE